MKVYTHVVTDQLEHNPRYFGISTDEDGIGYQKAMDWINHNQEWRGGERFEYERGEENVQFMWDMNNTEFKHLFNPPPDDYANDINEYDGAVFFGDFKLEFIKNDISGCYCNLFQYGATNELGSAYAYLEDGTPYEERYPESDEVKIPHRRAFEHFAEIVEKSVIDLLNNHPEYIEYAIEPTSPTKWYPDGQCNVKRNITRIA